ncbi:MAG: hypothetical protein ACOZF2_12480 [Thermodesulfobacteriota bacterium]
MANNYEKIKSAVFQAVDSVNEQLMDEQHLEKSTESVLLGSEAKIDSMALVNLIVATEEQISHSFNVNISLTDERALQEKESPFETLGTLIDYISRLFAESGIDLE